MAKRKVSVTLSEDAYEKLQRLKGLYGKDYFRLQVEKSLSCIEFCVKCGFPVEQTNENKACCSKCRMEIIVGNEL